MIQAYKNKHALPAPRSPTAIRAIALLASFGLASCGGGGGGGGGGSTGQPTIIATLVAFPTGSVPAGFVPGGANSAAGAKITDQSGNPITSAVVTVNGTALSYVAASREYEGVLTVAPGADVTFNMSVNGVAYTASRTNFSTYPTITSPAPNTTWGADAENLVSWSGTAPDTTSQYALGVFDTSGNLVWPSGAFQAVPTTQNSFTIPAHSLTTGSRLLLVGIVDLATIAGAAPGSGAVLGGFNYAPVTVATTAATLQSVATSPASIGVGTGTSTQLTATGTYSDSSTQDITASAIWSSSDQTKVTVSSTGVVTGVAAGTATVSAQYGGLTGSTAVTVFQPVPSPPPPLSQSVTYQIDYAHSGRVTVGASGPTFPPTATWSVTLNGLISYPVIVGGKVFVLTNINSAGGNSGTSLYAINETNGTIAWGPISIPGSTLWSGHAYDLGRLYVVNADGLVRSFDPATGAAGWTQQLPGAIYSAPPTAANGLLYVDGPAGLFALDETNGNILWSLSQAGGDHSSPAVSVDGVFVSHPCQVFKLSQDSSTVLWHYDGGCAGGGGKTSTYYNGRLFVRDPPRFQIFDAATGVQTGTFGPSIIPAFSATTGFFQNGGTLTAIDQTTQNTLWTFTGDGGLVSAPIVIDSAVIVASSSGNVYALDATHGNVLWTGMAGAAVSGPDEQNLTQPLTGLGAGEGYLVVPAGNVLTAWRVIP